MHTRGWGGWVAKPPIADNFEMIDFFLYFLDHQCTQIADNLKVGGWVRPCRLLAYQKNIDNCGRPLNFQKVTIQAKWFMMFSLSFNDF